MLREYLNELKNFNFIEKIKEGCYLDAKDQNKWKVGQVQQIKKIGHKIVIDVMFDGYSAKYNESYDLPSYSKLAPFRKFTLPYTGKHHQQAKRQQPSKTLEHYVKVMKKIMIDVDSQTSEQINQFLRGQMFIFIDYQLTRVSKLELKYSYDDYLKLFCTYLDMGDKILDKVQEFLKEVYSQFIIKQVEKQKDANLDQNYIYVHPKMALLYSLTQLLFNFNSLASKNEDRVTFHRHFGKHQSIDSIYTTLLQKMKSLDLYQKCQNLMNFRTLNGKSLPWSIKKQVLILIKSLHPQQLFVLPKQNKQIIQFIDFLPYFRLKSVITSEEEDKFRTELIFNLILGGNFEGKLIGLNQVKKLISYTHYNSKRDAITLQHVRQKNIIGFFLDNNNFNSELFKRALVVFQYAYKNKLFTKDHFSSIFKLHKDKHELQLTNFYTSIAEFGIFLNQQDSLEYFQKMIKQLPFEQNFIELVKNYTIVLIDKNQNFNKIYMSKDEFGFGLIYFWEHINSQTKINKDLIPKIIEAFATLLNNMYYGKHIEKFIVSSIKAIKENKNPESFLKVIHESLKLCKGTKMNKAIQMAQKQVNVIESAMKMLKQQQNNLSEGGFSNLFEFLEQVNYISRKGLTQSDILSMWKMDKQKCRPHLLRFLRKFKLRSNQQKSQQKIISKSLDIGQIQFIIKNIFQSDQLMQGYKFIDQEHYQTVDELILCYLHKKNLIDYNYKHTIRYKKNQFFAEDDKSFLGMSFYLKCIQNNDEKFNDVSIKATKRLIDIYLRPSNTQFKDLTQIKVNNWLRVSKAFSGLKNNRLRSITIQLQEIYGRMKSLNILEPDTLQIKAKLQGTNKVHTFVVPRYTSLWKFRLLLNDYFELQNTNFEIQLIEQRSTTSLEREDDLSVAFIITSRQKNGVSVLVRPSKQQHPHFTAIDRFKQGLISSYGQQFLKNLQSSKQQKAQLSLQILFKLPFVKSLQKSLQTLQFKQWSQLINPSSMKTLQYQLLIIQKCKDLKWITFFISKNGLKHLSDVVLNNLNKNNYKTINLLMIFFIEALKFTNSKTPLPFGEQFLKDILVYEKDGGEDYVGYLLNCFTLIKEVSSKIKLTSLFQKDKMSKILQTVLFTNKKSSISTQLIQITKSTSKFVNLNKHIKLFLNCNYLTTKMYQCKPFFQLLQVLIERGELDSILEPLEQTLLQVRNSDIKEKSQNQTNELLYGYLLCLYQFIKVNNNIEHILAEKKDTFFKYLLNECLFHQENISLRKFKSKEVRQLGFKFLQMMEFQTKHEDQINNLLIPMMSKGAWRRQFDWSIQPVEVITKKFTGLKNLAATCYINSLLQQLFYIKNFSSQLLSIDSSLIEDKQNIVREIQNIFGFLKYTQNPSYVPLSLCQTFILDGQPIDPRIQTDIDEFFHALMDKLERNLQKINKKDIINDVFRGQFSNLIIGQECPHTSQRIQHFLSIRLQIKNKKTIYQALDQFIKGEILQGENLYYCEKCDKKVKALKRVCLKELPQVMIVTLKRFQFNFDTMQKFKLNTYCQFPENINFLPYTKEGLQEDVQVKKQDYEYKLKGVVIHYGVSEAGHYTSYVRTDDKSWNYFDDQRISQFELKDLQKECFGGIQQNPFGDDEDKKKNAYLLIYQKVKPSKQSLQIISQQSLLKSKVYSLVQEDNVKTKLVNLLFEPNIETYLFNASELNPKAFLIYYHTVFLRNAHKTQKYVEFFNKSYELLAKKQMAEWYLKQITEAFLMQFVIYGQFQVKYIVTSLICQAINSTVDLDFIQQCIGLLYVKNVIPFAKIFNHAYLAHSDYAKCLTSLNLSEVILNLVKGKEIKQTNVIKKVKVRKEISEFGLAASGFIQKKTFDPKDLIQAIQNLKSGITLQQIKQLALVTKSKRTLKSLAIITAKKHKDIQQMKKLLDAYLINQLLTFDAKTGEDSYYGFLIQIVDELCKIKDKEQQQRVSILAKFYVEAMKQSLVGFRSQLMLMKGFFKMAMTNVVFRTAIVNVLNDKEYKKIVPMFKQWLKELPNVVFMIKNQKWGWWRKPKKQYPGLTTRDVQIQVKLPVKQSLSMLNSILEKHLNQQTPQYLQIGDMGYIEQKHGSQHVKVTRKIGFLVQVKDEEGNHRFVSEDDVVKKYL